MFDPRHSMTNAGNAASRLLPVVAVLRRALAGLCLAVVLLSGGAAMAQSSQPRTVSFQSADGKTMLTGYLFAPAGRPKTAPAVVLMHGRLGVYAPRAKGNYSSVTLDKDIRGWADFWAAQGYWALIVDSFGPRGYPGGFSAGAGATRPPAINELAVQPLDAYGALRYLRGSPRVAADKVALEGWSDGGSAALDSMSDKMLPASTLDHNRGFRAAVSLYPSCSVEGHVDDGYTPYAPVRIFMGGREPKASLSTCEKLTSAGKAKGGDIAMTIVDGTPRELDETSHGRQGMTANAAATRETKRQALAFVVAALGH